MDAQSKELKQVNLIQGLVQAFKEIVKEKEYLYQVEELKECKKTKEKKVVLRMLGTRFVFEKKLDEIISDNEFVNNISPLSIRALTYITTIDKFEQELSIVSFSLTDTKQPQIKITDKNNNFLELSLDEINTNKGWLKKFSHTDAYFLGYMKGLKEAYGENELLKEHKENHERI